MHIHIDIIPGRFFILVSFLLVAGVSAAQPDSLYDLPEELRGEKTIAFIQEHSLRDSGSVVDLLILLEKRVNKKKDYLYRQQLLIARTNFEVSRLTYAKHEEKNALLKRAIEEAHDNRWLFAEAALYISLATELKNYAKWGPAFVNLLKGYDILQKHGLEDLPDAIRYHIHIGDIYYQFGEYNEASEFLHTAFHHPYAKALDFIDFHGYNMLAMCYQRINHIDSALFYYQKAYENAVADSQPYWPSLIHGNMGQLYFENGEYEKALPLMREDFDASIATNHTGAAANAAHTLTAIYLQRGDVTEASKYMEFASLNLRYDDEPFMESHYKNRFALYKARGLFKEAALYADSAIAQVKITQALRNKRVLDQAHLQVEVEEHASAISNLENARKRQVVFRNAVLLVMCLVTIILLQFIQRMHFKRKNERMVSTLNERMAKEELDNARAQLTAFTRSLSEKNELIDAIRNELAEVRLLDQHESVERADRLNQLLQSTILTDEDWAGFRINFEKIFPGFFIRLREKMPDLTPADTRLLALTKLHLSTKEMAGILGISTESIKKSRQRLRRRLNLPEEGSVDELVAEL